MKLMERVGQLWDMVGHTPLVKIESLSKLTGCPIFAKAEFLNPSGSVKDRAAKGIIQDAEKRGLLKPGSIIVEGSAGNTGIGLATLAAERGYKTIITIPDNQSEEKYAMLEWLGVDLRKFAPVPFANPMHFYHQAKAIADSNPGFFWANQFENTANGDFHFETTGPEIWHQLSSRSTRWIGGGSSSGLNVSAAYQLAQLHAGRGKTIVTLLCDHGTRYASRLLNRKWLEEKKLIPKQLAQRTDP